MKTLHDAEGAAEVRRRIQALRPDSPRKWGKMSVDQMLWHLSAALSTGLGELECARLDNLFKRTVLKWLVLRLPWPKGRAPSAPEMIATSTYEFEKERARLLGLLDRFERKGLEDAWPRHPAFGPLTGREWSWLQYRHVDHHLQQFGV